MIPPGTSDTSFVNSQIKTLMSPWMQYFLRYDPVPALEKVHCPVLAIGGDKDLQVPAAINLHLIQMALTAGHNKHATITQLPGLNHLFQSASTGSPDEYATIEETFSPTALTLVTDWILRQ